MANFDPPTTSAVPPWCPPAQIYPAVHIPQLDLILAAFEAQKGLLMALSDSIDQFKSDILSAVSTEFAEIAAKVDALEAAVQAGNDATAERDALRQEVADAQDRLSSAVGEITSSVGDLSTAGDDPVEPPVEP